MNAGDFIPGDFDASTLIVAAGQVISHPFFANTMLALMGLAVACWVLGKLDGWVGEREEQQRALALGGDLDTSADRRANARRLRAKGWRLNTADGTWYRPGGYETKHDGTYRYRTAAGRRRGYETRRRPDRD